MRNNKIKKLIYIIKSVCIKKIRKISETKYNMMYRRLLKKYGMNIPIEDYYIDPSAIFDDYDFKKITIGNGCIISRDVLFLNHDYSINTALKSIDTKREKNAYILKEIIIGNNCFIGARVTILPGTIIGDNCIIGAGAVIKGKIPNDSIVIGNPAKIISTVDKYAKKITDYIEV